MGISLLREAAMRKVFAAAKVGSRVRCVKPLKNDRGVPLSYGGPVVNEVYTVREKRETVEREFIGAVGFTLKEIVNEPSGAPMTEPFFAADMFKIVSDPLDAE